MDVRAINEMVGQESLFLDRVLGEVRKKVIGQDPMMDRLLIGLLTGGHVLLEGVPGLAKTLAVKSLCEAITGKFQRLQFTPDMLPADVVGTVIYNQQKGEFTAKKGPIFANLVLADEINRAPAKVQSALLEAMQEKQVTIGESTFYLDPLFMVMATQNPIEQEGTYPLAEAQLDRFMMHVKVSYPNKEEEKKIMIASTASLLGGSASEKINQVAHPEDILRARQTLSHMIVDDRVHDYIVNIVFATRFPVEAGLKDFAGMIRNGASPRASIALQTAARAHAFLKHRGYVTPDDVKAIGPDVLRHRIHLSYEAEAEEVTQDDVVKKVFETVAVP